MNANQGCLEACRAILTEAAPSAPVRIAKVASFGGPTAIAPVQAGICWLEAAGTLPCPSTLRTRLERLLPSGPAEADGMGEHSAIEGHALILAGLAASLLARLIGLHLGFGSRQESADRAAGWFETLDPAGGEEALQLALRLLAAALGGDRDPEALAAAELERMRRLPGCGSPDPSSRLVLAAARQRQLPFRQIAGDPSLWQLGSGHRSRLFLGAASNADEMIAQRILADRLMMRILLGQLGMPSPSWALIAPSDDPEEAAAALSFPAFVWPLGTGERKRLAVGRRGAFGAAIMTARRQSGWQLVEEHQPGIDHRLLIAEGRLVLAIRGPEAAAAGKAPASATASEVTASVHPQVKLVAEQTAAAIGFRTACLIYRTRDIARPHQEVGGGVTEIASARSLHSLLPDGIDPNRLGAALIGNALGTIPAVLLLASARDAPGLCDRLRREVPPGTGIAGPGLGSWEASAPTADGGTGLTALLLDRRIERAVVVGSAETLLACGLPVERLSATVLLRQTLPPDWMALLEERSDRVVLPRTPAEARRLALAALAGSDSA